MPGLDELRGGPEQQLDPMWFDCSLPTSCYPAAGYRKADGDKWNARIVALSQHGIRLDLERRFERGTGLAIELPDGQGETSTALTRVQAVSSGPNKNWSLICSFISPLSDEEIATLLELDKLLKLPPPQHQSKTLVTPVPADTSQSEQKRASGTSEVIDSFRNSEDLETGPEPAPDEAVLFQAKLPSGQVLRWVVRRLAIPGSWPLLKDRIIALQLSGPSGSFSFEMMVKSCRVRHGVWVVNGRCGTYPSREFLQLIGAELY